MQQLKERLAALGIVNRNATRDATRDAEQAEKINPREGTDPSGDNSSDEWAGAIRTRDLLLPSAGRHANRRELTRKINDLRIGARASNSRRE